jgi:DNA-binding response OmpR family regulator
MASPRRALVVEDELPVRELLRLHLDLAGFDVEESADGRDALRRLRESAFSLIMLDVMLPESTGCPSAARFEAADRTSALRS